MITPLTALLLFGGPSTLALKGLDPVDLIDGKELAGQPSLSATVGRYEYRFRSPENLKKFNSQPGKYALQMGGACGKMGALTGRGSPERWTVAEGKIFVFASDGCRTAFLSRKAEYFRPVPAAPKATGEDRKRAQAAYDRMVAAHGGREAVKSLKGVEWTYEIPYTEGGVKKIWRTKGAYLGRDRYAEWEQWDAGLLYFLRDGRRATEGKPNADYPVQPDELREFTAKIARNPIAILLGGAGRPTLATANGFVTVRDDIVSTVSLHSATGQIATVEFHDRHAGPIAQVTVEYSDYTPVNGLALPKTSRIQVNEGEWSKPTTITTYTPNPPLPAPFRLYSKS